MLVKEWKIWDEEEEMVKSETEAKGLVLEIFYKWIYVFGKKANKRMPIQKLWDHTIETKKVFMLRKEKVYSLLWEEREEMHKFVSEQLKKGYIKSSKLPQTVPVFFVEKKDGKKRQRLIVFNGPFIKILIVLYYILFTDIVKD